MKLFYSTLSYLFGAILFTSCSLVDHNLPPVPDVYVAGYSGNDTILDAKYWKNGQVVSLMSSSTNELAYLVTTGIAVSGNDVHVVGAQADKEFVTVGKYWKNGVLTDSWTNLSPARLEDIAVSGSDVFMAGYAEDGSRQHIAAYWKNGVAATLDDALYAQAQGIFVSGSDVYVAGNKFNGMRNVAIYWKNGAAVNLSDGENSAFATAIAVSGNDVHVVGFEQAIGQQQVAKYWKNGVEFNLSDGSNHALAQDVAISGSDVYVVGFENINGIGHGLVWKNGVQSTLASSINASSVTVANNDVYIAGLDSLAAWSGVAKYWKNSNPVDLSNSSGFNHATSIFVANP